MIKEERERERGKEKEKEKVAYKITYQVHLLISSSDIERVFDD